MYMNLNMEFFMQFKVMIVLHCAAFACSEFNQLKAN